MAIGNIDDPMKRRRRAQGPKSKALKFSSRLCVSCNSSRTQAADREFDRFHSLARQLLENGNEPIAAFENNRYAPDSTPYVNFFRYFAKLLCCQIAEARGPRPIHLSRFAIGETHQNLIWLHIDRDWTFRQILQRIGPLQYAAHGGLALHGDKRTGGPKAFQSTISVGPLRYVFFSRLNWLERCAIRIFHRDFDSLCRNKVKESIIEPLSLDERKSLGFD